MGVARFRLTALFIAAYMSALMFGIVWMLNQKNPPLADVSPASRQTNLHPN